MSGTTREVWPRLLEGEDKRIKRPHQDPFPDQRKGDILESLHFCSPHAFSGLLKRLWTIRREAKFPARYKEAVSPQGQLESQSTSRSGHVHEGQRVSKGPKVSNAIPVPGRAEDQCRQRIQNIRPGSLVRAITAGHRARR